MRIDSSLPLLLLLVLAGCGEGGGAASASASPPSAEERLRAWEELPEGTSVPVALGFAGPLPDSVIADLLTRHGVRPYAVYLIAAGMGTEQRREKSRASLELLGEAREQAVSQLRTELCAQPGRARALAAPGEPDVTLGRELLAYVRELQRAVPGLEAGEPSIYGVEVVGAADDVRALGEDPAVASWEPGWIERADTVVPPPPTPAGPRRGPAADSAVMALSGEDVRARIVDLAENGLGACESATPGDEPR